MTTIALDTGSFGDAGHFVTIDGEAVFIKDGGAIGNDDHAGERREQSPGQHEHIPLANGGTVKVGTRPEFDPAKHAIVHADVEKLQQHIQATDRSQYVGPGGTGETAKPGAYQRVGEHIAAGKQLDTPIVRMDGGKASVVDGRHRLAYLQEQGVKSVPVQVNKAQAAKFTAKFGTNKMGLSAIILDASELEIPKPIPAALEGLPTSIEVDDETKPIKGDDGKITFPKKCVPIAYYLKEAARTPTPEKKWTHRSILDADGGPLEFDISKADIDDTIRNFHERLKAGIKPFIPDSHVESRDAAANNGEVIDLSRRANDDGTHSMMAKMKVIGTRGQEKAATNDVSVYLVDGNDNLVTDAYGKRYKGRVLHHISFTPNPALPHLEPFQRIAASADYAMRDVPVFSYGAPPLGDTMSPQELESIKGHLASEGEPELAASLTVADAVPKLVAHHAAKKSKVAVALGLSADDASIAKIQPAIEALKTEKKTLAEKLAAVEREKLALSADDPTQLSASNLAAHDYNASVLRENAIKSGAISSTDAARFDKLFRVAGKPTRWALSASGDNGHPLEFNFWREMGSLATGIRVGVGGTLPAGVTADTSLPLDASPATISTAIAEGEAEGKAYQERQLKARNYAIAR